MHSPRKLNLVAPETSSETTCAFRLANMHSPRKLNLVAPETSSEISYAIRKVASPYVRFASQIRTIIRNLTLLLRKLLAIFPIQ